MAGEQEVTKYLGETAGFWVQTAAIALSALYAGAQVHLLRLQTDKNEIQARRRATIDLVLDEKQDSALGAARVKFASLRDGKANITQFACKPTADHPEENKAIIDILNHYEFIAVGIRENTFDTAIFKRMKKSLLIRDWDVLSGYALEMRKQTKHPKLFVEFEWLANEWRKENT
jgi:hypothetical protein